MMICFFFFFSSRRRHTILQGDWSSDVCSSDLGKRFDLGLYEAGTSHAVTFDAPGICYIFCNIHPEMSAVVVVTGSPYYAISDPAGKFSIPNVPPGIYSLSVWHERGKPENPDDYRRQI